MPRAAATADAFNAVGDATRREILRSLAGGEATVTELVDHLHLPQPQVSKHLRVLRDVDLVRCRAAGRHRLYRVHQPALAPVEDWLAELTRTINQRYDRLDHHLHAELAVRDHSNPSAETGAPTPPEPRSHP